MVILGDQDREAAAIPENRDCKACFLEVESMQPILFGLQLFYKFFFNIFYKYILQSLFTLHTTLHKSNRYNIFFLKKMKNRESNNPNETQLVYFSFLNNVNTSF